MTGLLFVLGVFTAANVAELVVGLVLMILIIAGAIYIAILDSGSDEANARLHEARRHIDVKRHRFEVRRDAERLRREIDDELR
jgi:hypothetical protein